MSLNLPTSAYLTGTANWSLPNGDWCFATLVRIDDNAGSQSQCFISAGPTQSVLEFNLVVLEDGRAATPGCPVMRVADGASFVIITSTERLPLGQWVLLIGQRASGEKQIWFSAFGSSPAKKASSSATVGACAFGTPLMIGRRYLNAIADTNVLGRMAYVAYGAFSLSQAEMTALAAGACPIDLRQWDMYLPLFSAGISTLKAPVGGQTFSVTGSPATDGQPMRLW